MCQASAEASSQLLFLRYMSCWSPTEADSKTMPVFVSLYTFHQMEVGCRGVSRGRRGFGVGQKQARPLLIHVHASQRYLWSGTKTAMLPFVKDWERLVLNVRFPSSLSARVCCWLKCRICSNLPLHFSSNNPNINLSFMDRLLCFSKGLKFYFAVF